MMTYQTLSVELVLEMLKGQRVAQDINWMLSVLEETHPSAKLLTVIHLTLDLALLDLSRKRRGVARPDERPQSGLNE